MSRAVFVLRPEPGASATAGRLARAGLRAVKLPLFHVRPLDWSGPDPDGFDALLLTSANALRHGGPGLERYRALPVFAVGEVTAAAARAAGFRVGFTGAGGAAELLVAAEAAGVRCALHLGGRERSIPASGIVAGTVAVYASELRELPPEEAAGLNGSVVMLHSPRAGGALRSLGQAGGIDPSGISLAAISAGAAGAAGDGWQRVLVAARPDDAALVDAAHRLAD